MPRLKFTERAVQDLREISTYTKKEWGPEQERRYRQQLQLELQKLSLNANLGRFREEVGPGIRSFKVASHIAFYMPGDGEITIVRLLHPSRDIERAFDRTPEKSQDQDRER
jgi:toxin ParE1/3/4